MSNKETDQASTAREPLPNLTGYTVDELTEKVFRDTLDACGGNQTKAAMMLKRDRTTVIEWIDRWGWVPLFARTVVLSHNSDK